MKLRKIKSVNKSNSLAFPFGESGFCEPASKRRERFLFKKIASIYIVCVTDIYRLDFHFIPSIHFPQRGKQDIDREKQAIPFDIPVVVRQYNFSYSATLDRISSYVGNAQSSFPTSVSISSAVILNFSESGIITSLRYSA